MRILFITVGYPTDETPGSSPCIEEQRRSLQQLGHDVDVLIINGKRSRLNYLRAAMRVFWAAQVRKQYDLIHAHYGYSGVVARAQFRCPVVVTFRGSDILVRPERLLNWVLARFVHRTIVMTEEMKRMLGRSDTYVIPYGIDLDLFIPRSQAEARRQLNLPLEGPRVLFPYDPSRRLKRFDLVEQAVTLLKAEFPRVEVLTIFNQPHGVIASYMNACDAMILASDSEGAPVAVREAMACNLPIVSVDVGDVAEVIRGTDGCHLAKQHPQDIAEKLAHALKSGKRTNGRLAVERMGLQQVAIDIVAVYESLLDHRAHKPAH